MAVCSSRKVISDRSDRMVRTNPQLLPIKCEEEQVGFTGSATFHVFGRAEQRAGPSGPGFLPFLWLYQNTSSDGDEGETCGLMVSTTRN